MKTFLNALHLLQTLMLIKCKNPTKKVLTIYHLKLWHSFPDTPWI